LWIVTIVIMWQATPFVLGRAIALCCFSTKLDQLTAGFDDEFAVMAMTKCWLLISNTGYRCERCDDGYYDSRAASAAAAAADGENNENDVHECLRCRCNNNIDSNAVGNCDRSQTAITSLFRHVFIVDVHQNLSLTIREPPFHSCLCVNIITTQFLLMSVVRYLNSRMWKVRLLYYCCYLLLLSVF